MRDEIATYRHTAISRETIYDYDNPYHWPDYLASTTSYPGSYLSRFKGRSDITKGNGSSPTVYRAYDYSCDGDSPTITQYGNWLWRYNSPPHVPIAGKCWRRIKTKYSGGGSIPATYTLHGLTVNGYPEVPSSVRNEARTKALNQLVNSDLNFGQTLGEMGSTVDMLNRTILRVVRAYRAARRGDVKSLKRMFGKRPDTKTYSDLWLSYQFGWKPLVNDIYNFVSAISDARDKSPNIVIEQVVEREQPFPIYISYSYTGSSIAGLQLAYTYKLVDKELAAVNTLGLRNPLSFAWDLLPSSYIIDWFVPLGNVLSALNADKGNVFDHGYETEFRRGKFTVSTSSLPGPLTYSWDVSSFAMSRTIVGMAPKPGLYISSGLNLGKAITSVALINSRRA